MPMPLAQRRRPTIDERTRKRECQNPDRNTSRAERVDRRRPRAAGAGGRLGARTRQPGRVGEGRAAALQPGCADREGERDNQQGRDDRSIRVRDRLVRAAAPRVDTASAPDRLRGGRGRHAGDLDGGQDADRPGFAVSVPRPAGVGQDLHVPRPADLLRRLDRQLVGVGVVRRARADDRGQGLAGRLQRNLGADDRRADRRRARAGGGRDRPGRTRSRR